MLCGPKGTSPHGQEPTGTYLVTLKILSNRRARSTLIPKEVPGLTAAQTTSKMLPTMTCNGDGVNFWATCTPGVCGSTGHDCLVCSASTCPPGSLRAHRPGACPPPSPPVTPPGGHRTERQPGAQCLPNTVGLGRPLQRAGLSRVQPLVPC